MNIKRAVKDYLIFEEETSIIYPFQRKPTKKDINIIVALCTSDDTEEIYECCCKVLGNI